MTYGILSWVRHAAVARPAGPAPTMRTAVCTSIVKKRELVKLLRSRYEKMKLGEMVIVSCLLVDYARSAEERWSIYVLLLTRTLQSAE
jgi:hypothetical protein